MANYPQNTMANFTTELYEPLQMNGLSYEVALVEITIPIIESHDAISGTLEIERIKDGRRVIIEFAASAYEGKMFADFYDDLNSKCFDALNDLGFVVQIEFKRKIFEYKNEYVDMSNLPDGVRLYMYGNIADVLSLDKSTDWRRMIINKKTIGYARLNRLASLLKPLPDSIYVYSDIIEYQHVGDGYKQLLRNVHIQQTLSKQNIIYDYPHYVPVSIRNTIPKIQISIKDGNNTLIPFKSGIDKVIAKLHFRPTDKHGFK